MPREQLEPGRFFGDTLWRREVCDLALVVARHPAGSVLPRHHHERAYFCVHRGGSYVERYGRQRRICRPGTIVVHPAGECHDQRHDATVTSLNVELGPSWTRRLADAGCALDRPVELPADDLGTRGALVGLLGDHRDVDAPLALESLCWEILAAAALAPTKDDQRRAPRWLRDARDLLDRRFDEPLALAALASAAAVHPAHFAAAFRRFYGCTAGEYRRRLRLAYVRRRLDEPDVSLAELACSAGFADQSHLTRAFKRSTGVTPAAYRRSRR